MADENLDAYLCLSTTEIKADIDAIIKIKKQPIVLLLSWCIVHFFAIITLSHRQTENFKLP